MTCFAYADEGLCSQFLSARPNEISYTSRDFIVTEGLSAESLVGFLRTEVRQMNREPHLRTTTFSFSKSSALNSSAMKNFVQNSRMAYRNLVSVFIENVLRIYQVRREFWTKKFQDHLRDDAFEFADYSKFIEVTSSVTTFTPVNNLNGPTLFKHETVVKTVGSLKLVEASDQGRPDFSFEKLLGIELAANGGLKVEIANFTIDPSVNKPVFGELMVSLILEAYSYARRPQHEKGKMLFFTYADPQSFRMYTSAAIGFKSVPGLEEPITYEGRDWRVIGISAEDLMALPERLLAHRSSWKDNEIEDFTHIIDTLRGNRPQDKAFYQEAHVRGPLAHQFRIDAGRAWIGDNPARSLEIYLGNGIPIPTLFLPLTSLPLQEGSSFQTGSDQITYSQGILIFQWTDKFNKIFKLQIKTDPNLLFVSHLKYVIQQGEAILLDIEAAP